jgi:hypothetical protein
MVSGGIPASERESSELIAPSPQRPAAVLFDEEFAAGFGTGGHVYFPKDNS